MPNYPTPTAIRQAQGNPSGRPFNENEPKAIPGAPPIPEGFNEIEEAYWHSICETLSKLGTLNTCDCDALRIFCQASAIRDSALDLIEKHGPVIDTKQGIKKNPAVTVFNEQVKTIRALISEFGLTPSSRTKIHADSPETDDDFTKLMRATTDLHNNVRPN